VINLVLSFGKNTKTIPVDGTGLMVLGIGLALVLKI